MKKILLVLNLLVFCLTMCMASTNQKEEYLWLESTKEFYINFNNHNADLSYSLDKVNWTKAKATNANDFSSFTKFAANTKVYFKGTNGSSNSFWGDDWWGMLRTTTYQIYHSYSGDDRFATKLDKDIFGTEMKMGGNILSVTFGDEFMEKKDELVSSGLTRVASMWSYVTDASSVWMMPAGYTTNDGAFSSYGNQYGTFQYCYCLQHGPNIKYLSKDLFSKCYQLTDFNYWGETDGTDCQWFDYATSSNVQRLTIHVRPGVTIKNKPSNAVVVEDLKEDNTPNPDDPQESHQYVDLGLPSGTLWATCNIGADCPEVPGEYFQWGDSEPMTEANRNNIRYCKSEEDISGSNYDTAKNLWGAKWRMPTKKECEELYSNTTQTKSIVKGKNVLVVVGKNGNIMIVPESGHTSATGEDVHGVGFWTSTPLSSKYAYRQWEWEYVSFSEKEFGFPVRPVYCSNDPSSGIEDAIVDANSLSVRQYNGFITITNLKHGEVISVYSIAGSKILSSLASGNDMTLDLTSQAGRIVVVKIDHKTFKVRID